MPFDVRNLERTKLFDLFWNTHNDPDLSGGGLNELSVRGAEKLAEYAKNREVDGTESRPDRKLIDPDEKEIIKALLEHRHYAAFIEQDAKIKLIELFGLDPGSVHPPADIVRPKDAGEINLGERVSRISPQQLAQAGVESLPQLFANEYRQRVGFFEGAGVPAEEKSRRTLSLLRDYAQALWAYGETPATERVGNELLDAFEKTRSGKLANKDYNAAGWNAAQSLVLGMDPNAFEKSFPKAHKSAEATYLSMNDGMVKAMSYVDKFRKASGQKTGAEDYEKKSPLGWLIGEESGHLKRGNLNEQRPFSTSGLNWGIVLFPNDQQIRDLPPKKDFEFPIDCLDSFSNFITCRPSQGEKLAVVDEQGKVLRVEKQIQQENGKPVSWSAKFYDANNREVDASKVLGVITSGRIPAVGTRLENVKGDGKAKNEVNMWWWGFCDRNTAQQLYKSKFGIPQLERAEVKVKAGNEIISIPKAEAQKLIDCDIPDLVQNETMCGFRFNDEPQQVVLKNGQRFTAKVGEEVFESGAVTRLGEDNVSIHDGPGRPILGVVQLKTNGDYTEDVSVKDIVSITKGEGNKVTIKMKDGWRDSLEGELTTEVPWNKAVQEDGKTVLKQTADYPIRGAVKMTLDDGTEKAIPAGQITQIVGEMQKDLRLSQFAAWVSKNAGMFATDSSTGEVVSNGMRWVNKIDQDVRETPNERPEWAPEGDLVGINGPLQMAAGDKIMWMRGMYAYQEGHAPDSSAFEGWVQVSKDGRIKNEAFTDGQPDFGWSADGPLNWLAKSSFNPFMSPEMRVAILVNGLNARGDELDALAKKLNLPANYRNYLVDQ
jgi:hypothetical protein